MFTDSQLELAFAYHMVQRLIGADDAIHRSEILFLDERFPQADLFEAGFLGDDGAYTKTWRAALETALTELKHRLSEERKIVLMHTLLSASLADRDFDAAEGEVLLQAATVLGLSGALLDQALGHDDVGSVELPAPESS
jgi:uncharacterized tellurite resistance protein B-like protein